MTDRTQALLALVDVVPEDVSGAWADVVVRGTGWMPKVTAALSRARALDHQHDDAVVEAVLALCGGATGLESTGRLAVAPRRGKP